MNQKYFIKMFGLIELEVDKERFIKVEQLCGFYPKVDGETATAGFGLTKDGLEVSGRIENEAVFGEGEECKSLKL